MAHFHLNKEYWAHALRDATFKYNIMPHSLTKLPPWDAWHDQSQPSSRLFPFGCKGMTAIPKALRSKLDDTDHEVRMMYHINHSHNMVQHTTLKRFFTIRTVYIRPINKSFDPSQLLATAFRAVIPTPGPISDISNEAPKNRAQTHTYPDKNQWHEAHNAELDQLDDRDTLEWLPTGSKTETKPIPLEMTYRYVKYDQGNILKKRPDARLEATSCDHMSTKIHKKRPRLSWTKP